jgi:hypothetical protein
LTSTQRAADSGRIFGHTEVITRAATHIVKCAVGARHGGRLILTRTSSSKSHLSQNAMIIGRVTGVTRDRWNHQKSKCEPHPPTQKAVVIRDHLFASRALDVSSTLKCQEISKETVCWNRRPRSNPVFFRSRSLYPKWWHATGLFTFLLYLPTGLTA